MGSRSSRLLLKLNQLNPRCQIRKSSARSRNWKLWSLLPKLQHPEPPSAKAPDIAIRKAVEAGNIEAVKQAVADGADVDSKNAEGQTPLCRAVQYGKKDVIKLLIEEGADVNARMNFGDTALDYANVSGGLGMSYEVQKEVVDLLRKHGAKTSEELDAAGKQTNSLHHLNA